MDDDDQDQQPAGLLLWFTTHVIPYMLASALIVMIVKVFVIGSPYELIAVRVAICAALAIATAVGIDTFVYMRSDQSDS